MDTAVWAKFGAGGVSCMMISASSSFSTYQHKQLKLPTVVLNPMDVIKVRLQLQNQLSKVALTNFHGANPYQGFVHAGMKIFQEEGYFGGLMKGFTPSMIRELSYSSLRMGLYDPIKSLLAPAAKSKDDFTLLQKIAAGACSGALGSALVNPTDLIKIRFQSVCSGQPKPYKHTFDGFYTIFQKEGFRGLYKGVGPTTLRASVLTSAQLSSYDHTKRVLLRNDIMGDNIFLHLTASIVSGLVTTTATNPVDIVKTRWMASMESKLYKSPLDCFLKTVMTEGPHALMKGWVPNYLRLGPHFILSLPLYEFLRQLLGADTV